MIAAEKEDLGLSLSLTSFSQSHHHQQRSLPSSNNHQKIPWINAFSQFDHRSSDSCHRSGAPLFLWGIDVNRSPNAAGRGDDDEEEPGVSSPNSTLSSVSGKRSERELDPAAGTDEHEIERASSRGISDEEDGDNSRKKLRLSKDQSAVLEESFREHNTLNPKQKLALAKQLGLRPRQVEVWFQNRRARTKLKQTEIDCEFLKRCCENLTEENRRLQKEVQELRALKLSPQFYMQMAPPTTLTMCPSCERVGVPQPSAASGLDVTRPITMSSGHHRPMPINPWAQATPVARAALRPGL
ncbi:hypothetical protein CDL15_Pgr021502 [Punica granatum]|uniref:Homeobox domain-containing protein n=1 Tax=Punica granatum TaxID=22663 RepID=A0A218XMD9_PUNGR|nr:hypothetical protein CDL15_Pgr021502 [Punica granatum]PKI39767.1 hypothetical protein CRG98_039812 [Punica granatum]